jgi:PAS domain-containing protein
VRLEPLYRVEFSYDEHYDVSAPDVGGIFFAEGRCEGELAGRFRGMNHPRRRVEDDAYLPNFQGVIETEDGATVAFDYRGYGRARDDGREVVGTAFHSTADERYARLNDSVCALTGEARDRVIRLEVAELVWEPRPE